MKRVYVNEEWCLGCHLCEYYCAFAASDSADMVQALKGTKIRPRIQVEGDNVISFAVSCRHCEEPWCVKACISGALSIVDGVVVSDKNKCVGCHTCILSCPYGCISPAEDGIIQKCELCIDRVQANSDGSLGPACVAGCPNQAIVFEDRGIPASGLQTGAGVNSQLLGGAP